MSGGIVQLVATGAQDAWLTGKPEVSFFRSTYRRYTHYANSVERQIIQGQPTPGGISTIRFEKKGDLLSYCYLTVRDSNGAAVTNLDWSKVIDKVELVIGGQIIDTQDFEYSTDIEPLTGAQTFSQRYLNNQTVTRDTPSNQKNVFYPFKFFFCKDWSVSLPLVALQFHDVELRITWSSNLGSLVDFGTTTVPNFAAMKPVAAGYIAADPTVAIGNTANIVFKTITGDIQAGLVMKSRFTDDSLETPVITAISNVTSTGSANVTVAFSNLANSYTLTFLSNAENILMYKPKVTTWLENDFSHARSATSGYITLASSSGSGLAYPGGPSAISVGDFVAGLATAGPVVVSNVSNIANSNIQVSFPAQTVGPTTLLTLANGTISFFPGTVNTGQSYSYLQTTKYSDLQFLCWANFVYLDESERNFFAKTTQDLLITQVNRITLLNNPVQELALAHPVKFLAFPSVQYSNLFAGGHGSVNAALYTLKTQINGIDVGEARHLPAWVDISQYYSTPYGYMHNNQVANVALISYCLDTSKLQPTGTLNFSRLDTFRLVTNPQTPNGVKGLASPSIASPYLYAVNYNVLRIQNGLGGLLYAN